MSPYNQSIVAVLIRADLATETFVIDHALRLVAQGVGNFTCNLAPGLYKFKFRNGVAINESYYEISGDMSQSMTIEAPALASPSAAPFRQTRRVSDPQLAEAERISSGPPLIFGHGSFLFIFLRSCSDAQSTPPVNQQITVHSLDGSLIMAVPPQSSSLGCAGLLAELDPGAYRLRANCDGQNLEQIVITSQGWQTQLFLVDGTSSDISLNILASASVLMSRSPFHAGDIMLRYADTARVALSRRSILMPQELLNHLLDDKFENPMLGIYAGHALHSAGETSTLQRLLPILEKLVPGHPDVLALSLGVSVLPSISVPPMLRRSWTGIINAVLNGRGQMEPGSLAARIPSTLLEGTPWLIWPESDLLPLVQPAASTDDQLAQIQQLFLQTSSEELRDQLSLNESEDALYTYLSRRVRMKQNLRNQNISSGPTDHQSLARVFETTVPNLQDTVDRLAAKLSNITVKFEA